VLGARAPKLVSGPEIFKSFMGESEAGIRTLFEVLLSRVRVRVRVGVGVRIGG